MTTTPISESAIADNVEANYTKLQALGFSQHQARTLIVSAFILLSNESKKQAPAPAHAAPSQTLRIFDVDGDEWVRDLGVAGDPESWSCPSENLYHRTREHIAATYGPIKEVWS